MGGVFGPSPTKPSKILAQQMDAETQKQALHYANIPTQNLPGQFQNWSTGPDGRPVVTMGFDAPNQSLFEGQQASRASLGGGLSGLLTNYMPQMTTPFDATEQSLGRTLGATGLVNQLSEIFHEPQRRQKETQLANQGLAGLSRRGLPNAAYDQAVQQLGQNQMLQKWAGILPVQQNLAQQQLASRQENFKNIGQLLDSSTPFLPVNFGNFQPPGINTPDMAKVNQTYYEQQQAKADAIGKLIGSVVAAPFTGGASLAGLGVSGLGGSTSTPWTQPGYVPSPVNQYWT